MSGLIITGIRGINETIAFLKHQPRVIKSVAGTAVQEAAVQAYEEILKNASRKDATLSELKTMDHPFARRHGSLNSGVLGGDWTIKPWMIHTGRQASMGKSDTGALKRSIKYKFKNTPKGPITIFYYEYQAPHVKYVVKGTKIMLPRDVIMNTLRINESKIKRNIRKKFAFAWSQGRGVIRTLESTSRRGGIGRYKI